MRKDVKQALRGRSLSFLGANREIRRLDDYLQPDEEVHDLLACNFGDTGGRSLLVVTDERILVFKDGWIFRNSQSMGYEDIKTIEIRTGLIWGRIVFKGEGMHFVITKVGRFSAEHAMKIMGGRIGPRYHSWEAQRLAQHAEKEQRSSVPTKPTEPSPAQSPAFYQTDEPLTLDQFLTPATPTKNEEHSNFIDELERLETLKEKGVLTPEEYAAAKHKLLT